MDEVLRCGVWLQELFVIYTATNKTLCQPLVLVKYLSRAFQTKWYIVDVPGTNVPQHISKQARSARIYS